ncbi:hypothetical protein SDC9_161674 [bioreactor metagenome]|uniref:Uncharacterized protein n=1 Tax=bioreactor metagenome TaxID=1076179 RepID=A0A645FJ06_9ZZZZ
MNPDLVSPAGFQDTLHKGCVSESVKNLVMGNGMFAGRAVREYFKSQSVVGITANMAGNCPGVLFDVAPNQCYIFSLYCVFKELFCQKQLCTVIFGYKQQA